MKLTKNTLQKLIKEEINRLVEAGEEDRFTKKSKPTKEKEQTIIDIDDEPGNSAVSHGRTTSEPSAKKTGKPTFKGARGNGPSLDSFKGMSVGDTLSAAASSEYEGDFDTDFDTSLANAVGSNVENEPRTKRVRRAGFGEPGNDVKRFQPNVPMKLDEPGLEKRQHFKLTKSEITKVLMDEFVQPAMSLGQQLLPTVYAELGRLMRKNPDIFVRQFSTAINHLREVENDWFEDLLGISDVPHRFNPPEGEEREMQKAIINVMKKYYNAVLGVASENSENLKAAMDEIRADVGDEEFTKAFFGALSDTRDIEDQAFGQLIGGLKRLR